MKRPLTKLYGKFFVLNHLTCSQLRIVAECLTTILGNTLRMPEYSLGWPQLLLRTLEMPTGFGSKCTHRHTAKSHACGLRFIAGGSFFRVELHDQIQPH